MAAAKVAEIDGRGVVTVSSSVRVILSDAGGSFSTHEIVAAAADARRENRTSRKRGEGKGDGSGEV